MKIEGLKNCSGCSACYSVCPANAIKMSPDKEGFLFPQIDAGVCIKCHKCEKVCPVLNFSESNDEIKTEAFACINDDEKVRFESSSGGIFSSLAEKVLKADGVVFGVKLDENQKAVFGFTETEEGLADFRGSKYVQAETGYAFVSCRKFLEEGRKVLFSGTPCQIAGLKSFLNRNYDNLLCVDIICHGVPSPELWQKYVEFREKKASSKTVKTAFRQKKYGWKLYSLSFTFQNNSEYSATLQKDPYLRLFLKDLCLRESCYNCTFKGLSRPSDLTIADFWGIQNEMPEMDDDKGTSLVFIHSRKGKEIFSQLTNCRTQKIDCNQGVKYNPSMIKSVSRPEKRDSFFKDLDSLDFEKLLKKYNHIPLIKRVKTFGGKCLRKIKSLVQK